MNPIVFEIGSIEVRHFTAWVGGGVLAMLAIIEVAAYWRAPQVMLRWLDVGIAGVLAGVVGARALHVAIAWEYFATHRSEIMQLELGGLAWHGALLAGLPAAMIMAWLRYVPFRDWTDAAALAWPVGLGMAWQGCRRAGCGYGVEVRTLADFPDWQVAELPDVYGQIAPRLDVPAAGMAFAGGLLALALLLAWRHWLPGVRLWLMLALTGLGMHILGYFRADPAHIWYDRRADQVLDLALVFFSTLIGGTVWIMGRRATVLAARRKMQNGGKQQ
jgi:prolipoprotein diacylglyceryltransferase